MRIIAWNCQMAFRHKFTVLAALNPDILVIPESESPAFLQAKKAVMPWPNHVWIGKNPAKGLGIFARDGIRLKLKRNHDPAHRFIAPVNVTSADDAFDLLAFWTQAEKRQSDSYVAHSLRALDHYAKPLKRSTLLLGDFNSSPVFKQNGKHHVELVRRLARRGFSSLYHRLNDREHGSEPDATFWLHRNQAKPYHLDYIFAHTTRTPKSFALGDPDDWLHLSDHAPLILDL